MVKSKFHDSREASPGKSCLKIWKLNGCMVPGMEEVHIEGPRALDPLILLDLPGIVYAVTGQVIIMDWISKG